MIAVTVRRGEAVLRSIEIISSHAKSTVVEIIAKRIK
jgi:hypothetical protein